MTEEHVPLGDLSCATDEPMPTKGSQRAASDAVSNQSLAEPQPDHLRSLVLNYLCHNCYLKTAEAFAKDSAVHHLDRDGDEIHDRPSAEPGIGLEDTRSQGYSTKLSVELVRNILLRKRIQFEILSGNVQEAIDLLDRYFPRVLATDGGENDLEMAVTDENVNPSRFEFVAETVNPVHLSLNLRVLAFIEACRTVPLIYPPPAHSSESPASPDSDIVMSAAPLTKRDTGDDERHQEELLIRVQKLYATVNALDKHDDRAIYLKELSNVGGLLAYTVPEDSSIAKYMDQERRDRVAEQINSAILHHSHMPSVSYLECAVRYTHCLWAMLHELRVKIPTAHRPRGISIPLSAASQVASDSEKETAQEARPFDLQLLLNSRA